MNKNYLNHLNKLMEGNIEDIIEAIDILNEAVDSKLKDLAARRNMILTANNTNNTNAQIVINKGKIVEVKTVEERIITDTKEIERLTEEIKSLEEQNESLRKENKRHLDRIFDLTNPIIEEPKEEIVEDTKEYENAYCGECMECTDQEVMKDTNELRCTQCGQLWERFEDEEDEDPIVEDTEEQEEIVEEDDTLKIEYINHVPLKNNQGYSFLYTMTDGDKTIEFTAVAQRNHRLPVVYDACPNDLELIEFIKEDINNRVGIYNRLDNDYAPDYRYHRSDDLFIYFDEAANVFKGYYCGNGVYGGRAFVFDINSNEGPCSRAFKQLIKDHKANSFGKFTTMNGKGKSITMWAERITKECRQLWKQSKNATKIDEAKVVVNKPWKVANEVQYNAAIKFLADMGISVQLDNKSYQESVDAELRHISELRNKGNNRYGRATVELHMNRAKELGLTNLIATENTKDTANNIKGSAPDDLSDIEL